MVQEAEQALCPAYIMDNGVELARVFRGKFQESSHLGHIIVCNSDGEILWQLGKPETMRILGRSIFKPFQFLPVWLSGTATALQFSSEEIAISCSSHSGEPEHLRAVRKVLAKATVTPDDLLCGEHPPYFIETLQKYSDLPLPFSALHNNCSGKHAAMLVSCKHNKLPLSSYLDFDHQHQQAIRAITEELLLGKEALTEWAVDGCSAPTYRLSMRGYAQLFAALGSGPGKSRTGQIRTPIVSAALTAVRDSMIAHPFLISGSKCEDLALMELGMGRLVSKVGAEGILAMGLRDRDLGIIVKVNDGSARSRLAIALHLLAHLEVLDKANIPAHLLNPPLRNARGATVGHLEVPSHSWPTFPHRTR